MTLLISELTVGDMAPDFSLSGSDGKIYRLADFRGKQPVVLAWFPKAFTPGCTNECKSFAAHTDELRSTGAAFFTVSVDPPANNAEFAKSLGAEYPILSDPEGRAAASYGVIDESTRKVRRWTFYIGGDGRIKEIDKNVKTSTHAEDAVDKLKELGMVHCD
jgi:thioredoxin-dependent peroxiredoxin